MIDTPQIIQTQAQPIARIALRIPRAEIRHVMGPGIAELRAETEAQGIRVTGPWFTHHLRLHPTEFDFEIGVPVAAPVVPAGRMKPGEWPAMEMARTVYHGPFEGLAEAWKEFDDWIWSQDLAPASDLWEVYLSGPESGSDSSRWRTELSRRLLPC